jgi:hypothetical protein
MSRRLLRGLLFDFGSGGLMRCKQLRAARPRRKRCSLRDAKLIHTFASFELTNFDILHGFAPYENGGRLRCPLEVKTGQSVFECSEKFPVRCARLYSHQAQSEEKI